MPGATTARLVVCDFEIPIKLFMIPQTVPNKSDKGAGRSDGRKHAGAESDAPACAASICCSREAIRALIPSLSIDRYSDSIPLRPPRAAVPTAPSRTAAPRRRGSARAARSRRAAWAFRRALNNSIVLDSQTVQVTTSQKPDRSSPPSRMSACMNMPQGLRSRGSVAAAIAVLSEPCCASEPHHSDQAEHDCCRDVEGNICRLTGRTEATARRYTNLHSNSAFQVSALIFYM